MRCNAPRPPPGLKDGPVYVTLKQTNEEKDLKTLCSIYA